jgi:hypothetical protein
VAGSNDVDERRDAIVRRRQAEAEAWPLRQIRGNVDEARPVQRRRRQPDLAQRVLAVEDDLRRGRPKWQRDPFTFEHRLLHEHVEHVGECVAAEFRRQRLVEVGKGVPVDDEAKERVAQPDQVRRAALGDRGDIARFELLEGLRLHDDRRPRMLCLEFVDDSAKHALARRCA